jgi:hypothetical protein
MGGAMAATEDRDRPKWTDKVTAYSTIVGGAALAFAAYQYYESLQQARIDIAIRAIADSGPEITYITQFCLEAGNNLGLDGLTKLHNRESVPFTSDAETISVGKCLADLKNKDRDEVFEVKNGNRVALTPRGAAVLAQRMNHALDKDEFISNLINKQIADKDLLMDEFGWRLCNLDKPLTEKLYGIVEQKDALTPIQDIVSTSCQKGPGATAVIPPVRFKRGR